METFKLAVGILQYAASVFIWISFGCYLIKRRGNEVPDAIKAAFFIFKDIFWVSVIANILNDILLEMYWAIPIDIIIYLLGWWLYKDTFDDDDRKKLKDKITGKVKSLGHKLVVVPNPT